MPETVEIGLGRSVRRGYHLDELALVPSRRTRGAELVSTSWQMDALSFDIPLIVAPSDAVVSPGTAPLIDGLGALAVLDGEGVWTRYADADERLRNVEGTTAALQALYREPVSA